MWMKLAKRLVNVCVLATLAAVLGGCVIVPWDGYYGHRHRGYYYGR
jgi:hypothetical protein